MSKKAIIITAVTICIIMFLVLLSAVLGFFGIKFFKNKSKINTEWGNTYYAYLKDAISDKNKDKQEDFGLKEGMENTEIEFIDVGEKNPVMVMEYEKDGNKYVNLYTTDGENQVDKIIYDEPSEVEFLYNIANESYSWYLHAEDELKDSYKLIYSILQDPNKNNEADFVIEKNEDTVQETLSGEKITLPKFDEIFVKPEIDENNKIKFSKEMIEKELKEKMADTIDNFKTKEEIITEEIKEQVLNKVSNVKELRENIKKAIEEIETDKKKKEEEEAAKTIKAGNYTLKCGTYKGTYVIADSMNPATIERTIVLNTDGTFSVTSKNSKTGKTEKTNSGKYKVGEFSEVGYGDITYYPGMKALSLEGEEIFVIDGNNKFSAVAGGGENYTYQGE